MRERKGTAALRRGLHKVGRARERLPLTNLGLAVAGLAGLAFWGFAKPHADYAISVVALLALGLVSLALVSVLLGAALVARRLRALPEAGAPLNFEAVRGFAYGLALPSWRWLPMLELTWTWTDPEGFDVELQRGAGRVREGLTAPARARAERIHRRFVIEDGFGLARWVIRHTERRSVWVRPYLGRLERAPLFESLSAGDDVPHPRGAPDGDRVDMRRYAPGDPLRLAMWKVYARTRQLMVRTPERAYAPSRRVVGYLPSAEGDEPAAAAARWAVERGGLGPDWRFGADGSPGAVASASEALDRIVESRSARDTEAGAGAGLEVFLAQPEVDPHARVVLFLPGRPGPWLDTVLHSLRASGRNATCVVCVDGVHSEAPTEGKGARVLGAMRRPEPLEPEAEATVLATDLERVVQRLSAAGTQVVAIDRATGRMLVGGRGSLLSGGRAA